MRDKKWLFGYCTSLKVVEYDGTMEEWRSLPKGLNWFKDTKNFVICCSDGDISHIISGDYTLAYQAITVTITDNGDGTATVTAAVPAGIETGKVVISTSSDLNLIPGSLKTVNGAVSNESYSKNGVSGACVSFSSYTSLPNGQVVFEADYRIESGASLDFDDVYAPEWNIRNSVLTLSTQETSNILKKLVK